MMRQNRYISGRSTSGKRRSDRSIPRSPGRSTVSPPFTTPKAGSRRRNRFFQRSLKVLEKAFGPEHLNIGIALQNLGSCLMAQQQYAAAELAYRRSLTL